MKVSAEQIGKRRYNNSTVYEFYVLVDDVIVKHQPNVDEPEEDRVFSIQVQDGLDATTALTKFLTDYKTGINPETVIGSDLPSDVEV